MLNSLLSTEIRGFERQLDLVTIVARVVDYYRRSFTGCDDTEFTDVGDTCEHWHLAANRRFKPSEQTLLPVSGTY